MRMEKQEKGKKKKKMARQPRLGLCQSKGRAGGMAPSDNRRGFLSDQIIRNRPHL